MVQEATHEKMICNTVRRFIERDVAPHVAAIEASDEFPQRLIDRMAEIGLFGLAIAEDYGGIDLSVVGYATVMEELAAGWSSLPSFLNSHCTVARMISAFGTTEQRARYLPRMAEGSLRGAITLTEPSGGSDLQAIRATALPRPGGGYALNGNKIFITNGLRAGLHLVLVKTDPKASPPKLGISMMIVESGTPGFTVPRLFQKMGFKHVDTAELLFDEVALPAEALLGGVPGKGLAQLLSVIEIGRIAIAATAVGVARAAMTDALRYAKEREAFGQTIANYQAIQIHLANMATKVTAARCITLEAARVKEAGGRSDMLAGMAKLFASEAAMEVTCDAMRVHGGYGYVSDFQAERLYREAPIYVLTEGSNEIQRNIIARRMLGPDGAALLNIG